MHHHLTQLGRLLAVLTLLHPLRPSAADWPTHRADNSRSGATAETLPLPLHRTWSHRASQPPQPAWPAPARSSIWQRLDRIEPRVVDDHVFPPVVARRRVFYASSADDQVHALNLDTGEILWSFFTEGPIRHAPALSADRVLVGSDDGFAYCLNAADGSLLWRRRVGPADRRIPGNGRLISTWPVRSSVLVQDDTAFCFAGLFPSQGVYAAAFRVADGTPVYRERIEESPEGYLLAAGGELYAPTGRGNPVAFDPKSGKTLRRYDGVGGTFALAVDDTLVAGPGNDGSLTVSDRTNRASLAQYRGRQMVVSRQASYLLSSHELSALDRPRFRSLTAQRKISETRLQELRARPAPPAEQEVATKAHRKEISTVAQRLEALDRDLNGCTLWRSAAAGWETMILAGPHLFLGGTGRVAAVEARTGRTLWTERVTGRVLSLAAAGGSLLVSTDLGELHCFSGQSAAVKPGLTRPDPTRPPPAGTAEEPARLRQLVEQVMRTAAARQGYALLSGSENLELALALARATKLHITLLQRDPARSSAQRRQLAASGRYGSQISVLQVTGGSLPLPNGFANLVVDECALRRAGTSAWPEQELSRVLRPCGALGWWSVRGEPFVTPPLEKSGQWTHLYGNAANTSSTDDPLTGPYLALQWFGGPGPQRMIDRHLRGPAPLVVNGRMFIAGENRLIGIDAFNGTELWELAIPGLQRYSIPYDAGYLAADEQSVCAAVQAEAWVIDAATGAVRRRIPIPRESAASPSAWGYVACSQGRLFGTVQAADASRTEPSYAAIDQAYESRQPMVTSRSLFSLEHDASQAAWQYAGGAIVNATLTLANDRVYFFESRNEKIRRLTTARISLSDLTSSDFYLVALDAATGRKAWEQKIDLRRCENILYLAAARDRLIAVGSGLNEKKDAQYHVLVLDAADGSERWRASHDNGTPGALGHGEQVHHPVILGGILVAEPVLYDLEYGKPYNPEGKEGHWPITRPGHSCGTMSGAGQSLFFRANNPTMLNVGAASPGLERLTKLAPSRPGCWINIIPANGLVLLPEASAGCVCNYPIQASMAFRPQPTPPWTPNPQERR